MKRHLFLICTSAILVAFRSLVVLVRTDSGAVYIFSATSPTESGDEHWPLMKVIIDSVRFHE